MKQTKLLLSVSGIAAIAAAAACATHRLGTMGSGNVQAPITVRTDTSDPAKCIITAKEDEIRAHKDKWIEFRFASYCKNIVTASVGNFRTEENPSGLPSNCAQPYFGSLTPIFRETDASEFRTNLDPGTPDNPDDGRFKLHVTADASSDHPYYFDVCLNDEKQKDPRLIIEP